MEILIVISAEPLRTPAINGWTQADTAKHMGITQPEASNIVRGRLRAFTIDRLIRCLNAADQDVQITIRPGLHAGGLVTVGRENQS